MTPTKESYEKAYSEPIALSVQDRESGAQSVVRANTSVKKTQQYNPKSFNPQEALYLTGANLTLSSSEETLKDTMISTRYQMAHYYFISFSFVTTWLEHIQNRHLKPEKNEIHKEDCKTASIISSFCSFKPSATKRSSTLLGSERMGKSQQHYHTKYYCSDRN